MYFCCKADIYKRKNTPLRKAIGTIQIRNRALNLHGAGLRGDLLFPSKNSREADLCSPKADNQRRGIPSDAPSLLHRTDLYPNQNPNRSPAKRVRFGKGRRTQRIWSFHGSYANRGNVMELSSSDVVPVAGVEPARHKPRDFKSRASTNSATPACRCTDKIPFISVGVKRHRS